MEKEVLALMTKVYDTIGTQDYGSQTLEKQITSLLGQSTHIENALSKFNKGEKVAVIDTQVQSTSDLGASNLSKVGVLKKISFDKGDPYATLLIEFSDGDPNSPVGKYYKKSYNYPSDLFHIFTTQEFNKFMNALMEMEKAPLGTQPKKPSQSLSSPYTQIINPYATDNKPPPVSALASALYGSNAYENPFNPNIDLNFDEFGKAPPPKCPQITGGSAPKFVVANPNNGKCILVKKYKTNLQPVVETFCSHIHRALGMPAPDMRFYNEEFNHQLYSPLVSDSFQPLTATKLNAIRNGQFSSSSNDINTNAFKSVVELLMVSTWLGNWDVLGMNFDNTLIDSNGNVQCIDLGGGLMMKATGGFKSAKLWKPFWDGDYLTIKSQMALALVEMQMKGNNKNFSDFLTKDATPFSGSLGLKYAKEITAKMMMLCHPKYNYVEKLTVWTDLPQVANKGGYYSIVKYTPFPKWLEVRALALYELMRGI